MMMALLLPLVDCAIPIHDAKFCSPPPGEVGAVCDNFLTSDQQILNETQWGALQTQWIAAGQAIECTQSQTLGDIKEEIEQLCSMTKCDYPTQQAITQGLKKIQQLGKNTLN
jgi:hypothetical protein